MKRNLAVFASALMLAAAVSGCGKGVTLDGTETAATLDDTTNMTLGEFNLMLRYQEAQMETYYAAMLGTSNVYAQDLSGTGTIYGETAKETLLADFEELYVLEAEAPNYGVELTDEEMAYLEEAYVPHHGGSGAVRRGQFRGSKKRTGRGSGDGGKSSDASDDSGQDV